MKISKYSLFAIVLVLGLGALYPVMLRHPVSIFLLKTNEGTPQAYQLSAPLNGGGAIAEMIPMSAEQRKEAAAILERKDVQKLATFSKKFGFYQTVIGFPAGQADWPDFLGGGIRGIFTAGSSDTFDNLQRADRVFLALSVKMPPLKPPNTGGSIAIDLPVITPTSSIPHLISTPNPTPASGTLRVEILNGCGITNAAEWLARRIQGPGIVIMDTGNADNFKYPRTLVQTAVALPDNFLARLDHLGLNRNCVETTSQTNSANDVVVIIGKDYPQLRKNYRARNRH